MTTCGDWAAAVVSQTPGQCGTGTAGAPCGSCAMCQTCSGGQCQGCATGCCTGTTCQIGDYENCGTGAGTCIHCEDAPDWACDSVPNRCQCVAGKGCCIADVQPILGVKCEDCCAGFCKSRVDSS